MGAIVTAGQSAALGAGASAPIAYLHGFDEALRLAAVLVLAGAIVAVAMIRNAGSDSANQPRLRTTVARCQRGEGAPSFPRTDAPSVRPEPNHLIAAPAPDLLSN
jgi:hypothetical protein